METETEPKDYQVGGTHYQQFKIQPIEFIMTNNIGFAHGNVIKYVVRHKSKGGIEDLKKALHYVDFIEKYTPFEYELNPEQHRYFYFYPTYSEFIQQFGSSENVTTVIAMASYLSRLKRSNDTFFQECIQTLRHTIDRMIVEYVE